MKLIWNKKLSNIARELTVYSDITELLLEHKIPCISQCMSEFYADDDRKMFEFGHKYWNKQVISFWSDNFSYYAIGSVKEIEKILKKELKEIDKEE